VDDQQRVVSAESRPIPQTAPDRLSERERSHFTPYRCEGCGRQFAPKRRWQRSCGLPRCRAATSRRRRADELRNELEGIAEALDQDSVERARAKLRALTAARPPGGCSTAKLQALISTVRDGKGR
jgi:hypothetical protein